MECHAALGKSLVGSIVCPLAEFLVAKREGLHKTDGILRQDITDGLSRIAGSALRADRYRTVAGIEESFILDPVDRCFSCRVSHIFLKSKYCIKVFLCIFLKRPEGANVPGTLTYKLDFFGFLVETANLELEVSSLGLILSAAGRCILVKYGIVGIERKDGGVVVFKRIGRCFAHRRVAFVNGSNLLRSEFKRISSTCIILLGIIIQGPSVLLCYQSLTYIREERIGTLCSRFFEDFGLELLAGRH